MSVTRAGLIRIDARRAPPAVVQAARAVALKLDLPPSLGQVIELPRNAMALAATDATVCPSAAALRLRSLEPRPYQDRAMAEAFRAREGVIEAPTGSGKTRIALGAATAARTRTLVLVHTRDLVAQWVRAIQDHVVGATSVVVDSSKPVSARFAVATVQQLVTWPASDLAKWGAQFGAVIVDEAHHVPASTWTRVMGCLPARYRWGVTATPARADGREHVLYAHLGRTCARVDATEVERAGAVLRPTVFYYATGFRPPAGGDKRASLDDPKRNRIVLGMVQRAVKAGGRVLVLVERVEHVESLVTMFTAAGVSAAALHGERTTRERTAVLARARAGRVCALVATSLADEALDVPALDTVILAVPCGVSARTQQRVGRVLRPAPGKAAVVLDLVDSDERWIAASRERDKLYTRRGWRTAVAPRS